MDRKHPKARTAFSANLKALMEAQGIPDSQSSLKRRSGVSQATIDRILEDGGENARIETVERIAFAYGLEAWQLLVPGMSPSNPPVLGVASPEEKALYDRLRVTVEDLAKLKQ